jgi:hypothetical protein
MDPLPIDSAWTPFVIDDDYSGLDVFLLHPRSDLRLDMRCCRVGCIPAGEGHAGVSQGLRCTFGDVVFAADEYLLITFTSVEQAGGPFLVGD